MASVVASNITANHVPVCKLYENHISLVSRWKGAGHVELGVFPGYIVLSQGFLKDSLESKSKRVPLQKNV